MQLSRVLVANRGEIAVRLIESCKKIGITAIAIFVEEDADSPHVRLADEAYELSAHGTSGYLDRENIIELCRRHDVRGVIPGYGFLSENAEFARELQNAGVSFIGPSPRSLEDFGLKHRARELAIEAKVPVVPGTGIINSFEEVQDVVKSLGFPVMVKATAGGGGMGLQTCYNLDELKTAIDTVRSRGHALFQNSGMFIEKYVEFGRHIEAQVFGNGKGQVVFLGERECSIQRRHQKVIEETPSPFVITHPELREKIKKASILLAESVNYKSAGTIEFLVDDETGESYFLEMNTRLQVEHGITEMCYDVDLVEMMLLQAEAELASENGQGGLDLKPFQRDGPVGHAIELRVYAENPAKDFMPSPGLLQNVSFPSWEFVRVDTWIETGITVSPSFDPLLAKIMVHSATREDAINAMQLTLRETVIQGPPTNIDFLSQILQTTDFQSGYTLTSTLSKGFVYQPSAVEVLTPGASTSIQDYPGRVGVPYGVPPSGPMDSLSLRAANIIVGNDEGVESFEITMVGPRLRFYGDAIIALCGAPFKMLIDGQPASTWARHLVKSGAEVIISDTDVGARAYLAVRGGLPSIASYFGSKSTAPTLDWGGYQGRCLKQGDFLSLTPLTETFTPYELPEALIPNPGEHPKLFALPGPWYSAPFLSPDGQKHMFSYNFTLSHESNRTGIRFNGMPPAWGRLDGGEGGSHPSNLVGFGAPTGAVTFTGDSGVIYALDGPVLTGFIVTQVIAQNDLWRLAQLRPGDKFSLTPITWDQALMLETKVDHFLRGIKEGFPSRLDWTLPKLKAGDGVLHQSETITVRQAGEKAILLVFNANFSIRIRARVEQLACALKDAGAPSNLVAANCSVYIPFDPRACSQSEVVRKTLLLERSLAPVDDAILPCRIIHLPAVFDPPECREAVDRYMTIQRSFATYLPDNIEFIRSSNGLKTREDVKSVYFEKSMLVNVVGWLKGLPIYNPLDPRDHLIVPKYNPSRTWTKAGSLGTGGMSCSIYSTDGPGGHMLWGVTIPGCCWDTFGRKPGFTPDKPWLFQAFDQIIFHEVPRVDYDNAVKRFRRGQFQIEIEPSQFEMAAYDRLLADIGAELKELRDLRKKCTEAEIKAEEEMTKIWLASKEKPKITKISEAIDLIKVSSEMLGKVWKVNVQEGDIVKQGDVVVVLEAMKMEIAIRSPSDGVVDSILKSPGDLTEAGDILLLIK